MRREPLSSSLLSGILTVIVAIVSVAAVVVVMHVMVVVDYSECWAWACGGDIALVINNLKWHILMWQMSLKKKKKKIERN